MYNKDLRNDKMMQMVVLTMVLCYIYGHEMCYYIIYASSLFTDNACVVSVLIIRYCFFVVVIFCDLNLQVFFCVEDF